MSLEHHARLTPRDQFPLLEQIQADPLKFECQIADVFGPLPETLLDLLPMYRSISTTFRSGPQKHLAELYINIGCAKNAFNLNQNVITGDNLADAIHAFLTYSAQQEKAAALTKGARRFGIYIGLSPEEAKQTIKKLKTLIPQRQGAVQPA